MAAAGLSDEDRRRGVEGIQSARDALAHSGPHLSHLPPDDLYERLPRHVAGANVVYRDETDQVLLVQPAYRPQRWQIPGGWMDPGEHPFDTARREIHEELGLTLQANAPLVAVDWVPATDTRPAAAAYVFDGGRLTQADARRRIRLQTDELAAWRFASPDQWPAMLTPPSARRLQSAITALQARTTAYLQHGRPRRP